MRKLGIFIPLIFFSTLVLGETVEIYTLDNLDDDRGFCIDIKGHKSEAHINNGLQAHTCYSYQGEIAVDQGFDAHKLKYDQFYLTAFDVCMEATSLAIPSSLLLSACHDGQRQQFRWDDESRIKLIHSMELCLTVARGNSRKGGGGSPVHLIRNLSLELCSDTLKTFQKWGMRKIE